MFLSFYRFWVAQACETSASGHRREARAAENGQAVECQRSSKTDRILYV